MNTLHSLLLVSVLSFFCSCIAVMPASTPNVPLLEKKGDIRMTGNLTVSQGSGLGGGFEFAGSPANHFYLGASGSYLSYGSGIKSMMMEIGAGSYLPVGNSFKFDIAGGGGFGTDNVLSDHNSQRLYIQSALAYSKHKFECALGAKFNHTIYNETDKRPVTDPPTFSVQSLDPFFLFRFGGPVVKFQLLGAYPIGLSSDVFVVPDPTISFGVNIYLKSKRKG